MKSRNWIIGVFIAAASVFAVALLPRAESALSAASVAYRWVDQQTIRVTGAGIDAERDILLSIGSQNPNLPPPPPGSPFAIFLDSESGSTTVKDTANDCLFELSITIDPSGIASATGESGSYVDNPGDSITPCPSEVYNQYTQDPITFSNTRSSTSVAEETPNQRLVVMTITTTTPVDVAEPTITATIVPAANNGGATTRTVALNLMTTSDETARYNGSAEVEPGSYVVSDSVGIGSETFEKVKFQTAYIEYGETPEHRVVIAYVELTNYEITTTGYQTFGPLTLVLTPPDGSAPVETRTTFLRIDETDLTGVSTEEVLKGSIYGTFEDVSPSQDKYRVCVKDTSTCAEFVKVEGVASEVYLRPTGDDLNKIMGDTDNENTDTSCESSIGLFGGLVCPVLDGIDAFIGWAEGLIKDRLTVDLGNEEAKAGLQSTWLVVARLASGILVAIALVMVIATALGSDMVSPYALKKVLPRLVIGAMGIWTSWALVTTYIGIMNDLGAGIQSLMLMPFGLDKEFGLKDIAGIANIGGGAGGTATGIFTGLATAGIVGAGVFGILGTGLTALSAFIVAIFVLALRQAVIVFLVVLAPLGFAMWILPNTQKTWKLWSGTLNKLLIMYPMIMGLLTAGKIFAWITSETAKSERGFDKFLAFSIALIAYVAPYFFLPAVFKAAGGAFSNLTGMVNDKSKGLFDKSRGWLDKKKALSNRELAKKNKEAIRAQQRNAAFAGGMLAGGARGAYRRARYGGLTEQTRLRRRAAAIGIQSADQEKAYKDQSTLLDHDYRAQATQPGGLNERDYLLGQAISGSGDRRQAAIDRLSAMRAVNHLERLHTNLSGSAGGRSDWETAIRRNRENLREAAPHIASSSGLALDINSLRTASADSANKWSMDTWQSLVNSGAAGRADATRIAREIRANREQWARVGGRHNPTAPAGTDYNGMKDFFGRTLGVT